MKLSETIVINSDQVNAEDFLSGPRTCTIVDVSAGSSPEQPLHIHLAEFPNRTYRPNLTMRKLLEIAWNDPDIEEMVGRRLTLFRDPRVKWGGKEVGGIVISHLSHMTRQKITVSLAITRGKTAPFTVEPLPEIDDRLARMAVLRAEWNTANPERKKEIQAEVAELQKAVSGE